MPQTGAFPAQMPPRHPKYREALNRLFYGNPAHGARHPGGDEEVVVQAYNLTGGEGLLFPSPTGKPLTDNTLSKLFRENEIGCVPHSMRTSLRVFAAEHTDYPREIAEHALHHIVGSAAERAYQRSDLFDKRQGLMQDWADFLSYTCKRTEHRVMV